MLLQIQELPKDYGEGAMKNINQVGPSDARQAEIDALMNKLRQRGSVADSSTTSDAEKVFSKPPPPPPPPPPDELIVQMPAALQQDANETMATSDRASPKQTTSGIGGSWAPNEDAEASGHKPKVSTWGVFERPSDISKAYGGGRKIGVDGYKPSEEEMAKKRKETEERLAKYRQGMGADAELEQEHMEEVID